MNGWAVTALLVLAVALLVRLKMGSSLDSKQIQDWLRRF